MLDRALGDLFLRMLLPRGLPLALGVLTQARLPGSVMGPTRAEQASSRLDTGKRRGQVASRGPGVKLRTQDLGSLRGRGMNNGQMGCKRRRAGLTV